MCANRDIISQASLLLWSCEELLPHLSLPVPTCWDEAIWFVRLETEFGNDNIVP